MDTYDYIKIKLYIAKYTANKVKGQINKFKKELQFMSQGLLSTMYTRLLKNKDTKRSSTPYKNDLEIGRCSKNANNS